MAGWGAISVIHEHGGVCRRSRAMKPTPLRSFQQERYVVTRYLALHTSPIFDVGTGSDKSRPKRFPDSIAFQAPPHLRQPGPPEATGNAGCVSPDLH